MRRSLPALFLGLTALLVSGIAAAPAAQAKGTSVTIAFNVVMTPKTELTSSIGNTRYGFILLTGEGSWKGDAVKVERHLSLNYTNGDGPANGFATLIWPDGSQIAMEGSGFTNTGSTFTDIFVSFQVFATTGRWKGYKGIGRQDCVRIGDVETPTTCTYTVKLHKN
jgi:hypothetical protein